MARGGKLPRAPKPGPDTVSAILSEGGVPEVEIPEHLQDLDWQDIGHGVRISFAGFHPDRELNPQYADVPDVDKYMLLFGHECLGRFAPNGCVVDGPVSQQIDGGRARWQVVSWEPLTLSPSLLCRACGMHGFIQQGRWVPA